MPRIHEFIPPARLKRGDVIGIVAPSSPEKFSGRVQKGVEYLESLGYRVRIGRHVEERNGYLAGSDEQRADDLNTMFADRSVAAIFCTRGGYGSARILPLLDWSVIRRNPKIFVGFSDGTALNLALLAKARLISFTGAVPGVDFWKEKIDPFTEEHFWRMISGSSAPLRVACDLPRGVATEGTLVGGNLAMTVSLLGTPYLPNVRQPLWLLEDVTEEPYRIDRMLNQLTNAGMFRKAAGIAFGEFAHCEPKDVQSQTVDDVINDLRGHVECPVVTALPYGHIERKLTLPIGVRARIAKGSLSLLERGVV